MPEPAFLVEGQMEQKIVQRLCHKKTVRLIGCNGESATMAVVAKALTVHFGTLKNYNPIVILLDREKRPQTCQWLVEELSIFLDQYGYEGRYVVGFTDRTIESWILADWEHIRSKYEDFREFQSEAEGSSGKSIIRRLISEKFIYHETTIGVELFLKCRAEVLYEKSPSFKEFVRNIPPGCHWLSNIDLSGETQGALAV